jgi:flagellin-like protein
MNKQKGITPIIAILVMLLITIAITGSAWIYITTYYSSMTGKAIEISSIDCTSSGVKIYMRSIGTETIDTNSANDMDVSERLNISGDDCGSMSVTYSPASVGPGQSVIATDAGCDTSDDATLRYTIVVGGRIQKVQVTC